MLSSGSNFHALLRSLKVMAFVSESCQSAGHRKGECKYVRNYYARQFVPCAFDVKKECLATEVVREKKKCSTKNDNSTGLGLSNLNVDKTEARYGRHQHSEQRAQHDEQTLYSLIVLIIRVEH